MERKVTHAKRNITTVTTDVAKCMWNMLETKEKVALSCFFRDCHARYIYIKMAISDVEDGKKESSSIITAKTLMVGCFNDKDIMLHLPSGDSTSLHGIPSWKWNINETTVTIEAICLIYDLTPLTTINPLSHVVEKVCYNIIRKKQPNMVLLCLENGIKPSPNVIRKVNGEVMEIQKWHNYWREKNPNIKRKNIASVLEKETKNPFKAYYIDTAYQWCTLTTSAHVLTFRQEWDRVRGRMNTIHASSYIDKHALNYWHCVLALPSEEKIAANQLKPTSNILEPLMFRDDREKVIMGHVEEQNIVDQPILVKRLECPSGWTIEMCKRYMDILFSYRIQRIEI